MTYTHTPMRSRDPKAFDDRLKAVSQFGAALAIIWGGFALFILFILTVLGGPGLVPWLFGELPLIALPALVFTASVLTIGTVFRR